jgi:prefoldin alpha subunit
VPGSLSSNNSVLVDIGTGFYVEKGTTDARRFYEGKVAELHRSLGEIEKVVGGKEGNLRVVEEVLRGKVMSEQQGQQEQGGG